jgi:ABC-type tungstate transport system substrate-binding protein
MFFWMPSVGIGFLVFGILASDKKVGSIRIVATPSNIIMAILATPLYFILRGIQRKKRKESLHQKHERVP